MDRITDIEPLRALLRVADLCGERWDEEGGGEDKAVTLTLVRGGKENGAMFA